MTQPKEPKETENRGQSKTWQVTNPTTGETRTVTSAEWREGKLGQAGFEKPADLDGGDTGETTGGESGS